MKKFATLNLLAGIGALAGLSAAAADTTGNRYGYPVLYKSEISSAEAWLRTKQPLGSPKPIILDVRRVEEYVAGHPPGALSIPFPHVTGSPAVANDDGVASGSGYIGYDISVDPEVGFLAVDGKDGTLPISGFVQQVEALIPNKNRPVFVLCATGHRSVQASNALAKSGYTHVRNIWEGYNGQPKYAYTGTEPTQPLIQLDLNNDGTLDGQDRDGWAYFQGLPTETKIKRKLIDPRYRELYRRN